MNATKRLAAHTAACPTCKAALAHGASSLGLFAAVEGVAAMCRVGRPLLEQSATPEVRTVTRWAVGALQGLAMRAVVS